MRYAPLADTRLVAAVFVLPAYAAKPTRRERVSRRGPSGTGERAARALTQERAQRTLRRLQAGRTAAASRRPGERPPSLPTPDASPAMGSLPRRPDPRHTARPVKDHANNNPLRPGRGLGRAETPKGAPDHARPARRERARAARAVPAPDGPRRAGPHTPRQRRD